MRVDNGGLNVVGAGSYTHIDTGKTKEIAKAGGGARTQTDRTSLRATSELVRMAKTAVSSGAVERMNALSSAVGAGTYQADPDSISQALVNEHIQS